MLTSLPPLKIHTWGGLGSQLYAISLAEDLGKIFPRRNLEIVLHTGGVTRRTPEIQELFPGFRYKYQDDYNPNANPNLSQNGFAFGLNCRVLLKQVLIKLNFVATCNNDLETRQVKFWTFSIRGHYSYRSINKDFLFALRDSLKIKMASEEYSSVCSIHYRLGDLLSIHGKSPISEISIKEEYFRINEIWKFGQTFVFSDSPMEAKKRFSTFVLNNLKSPDVSTREVIATAIRSEYFIGTSSKISFWIAAIRAMCFGTQSSLPKRNLPEYAGLFPERMDLIAPYVTEQE